MIRYREGYRYQLAEDYAVDVGIRPEKMLRSAFLSLSPAGVLTIKRGYAWDGPSGPAIDTKNFMRSSLVHDALYQMLRQRKIAPDYRKAADKLLQAICREDGMSAIRAWWVYEGVRYGGGLAADPDNDNPILEAP